jgi:ATP-dependent Lhr-like helicase
VSPFERLHPAVQHHIVNSLGWKALRPLQEAAIEPVLSGEHALLLAPTAGGKTEAVILPILSRMLTEDWRGLSVVYVCPIKALLNNLEERLSRYAGLLGRRVAVWHGDISQGERVRTAREPPDLLLATPESLEVVLVSRRVDHRSFFKNVHAFVIDEIHAFAGDDRGWHLMGLLDRLSRLSGRPPQRLGLSATVGNAEALLEWLVAGRNGARRVVAPEAGAVADADVQVDFVGNLANAATLVSRLHRSEKRLVFCDTRSQVESLAVELRARSVRTFVSHSSLSVDARRQAESAFASGDDCVIVATSTLELGIDVGDLDRVIQIDAPNTVASFLQRLGRTGRRKSTDRNCLFLATTDDALLRAVALVKLWHSGFVEPIEPPPLPYHVLAQQLLALSLQESGIGKRTWVEWVPGLLSGSGISGGEVDALVCYMLSEGVLFEDGGVLGIGTQGEGRYGLKNFLELFSIFTSRPLFTVLHGRTEIGQVHPLTFQARDGGPATLALGGRQWSVKHVDWARRQAFVEPTELRGRSRWLGAGQPLSFALCQAVRSVLADQRPAQHLSRRATLRLEELREDYAWVSDGKTSLVTDQSSSRWWTFGGSLVNACFMNTATKTGYRLRCDDFSVQIEPSHGAREQIRQILESVLGRAVTLPSGLMDRTAERTKFIDCVPPPLRYHMISAREMPLGDCEKIARQRVSEVILR